MGSRRFSRSQRRQASPASSKQRSSAKPFSYRAIEPDGDLKPGLPVVVHGPKARIPMYGLVDSGADDSLFPEAIAGALGIDTRKCETVECETAGGLVEHFVWEEGLELEVQAMEAGHGVTVKPAMFSGGLPPRIVLLGRHDFFAEFLVAFDERAQAFSLERYTAEPEL